MEETKKDPKRKESKTLVRERTEKLYVKRGVVGLKHGTSKISGTRPRSKSPVKKDPLKSEMKVAKPILPTSPVTNHKSSPAKAIPSPLPESRCSKCGQKVDKRRVTN